MTREECEAKLKEKLWEFVEIYKQYNPEGKYISACWFDNGDEGEYIHFNNSTTDEKQIETYERTKRNDY